MNNHFRSELIINWQIAYETKLPIIQSYLKLQNTTQQLQLPEKPIRKMIHTNHCEVFAKDKQHYCGDLVLGWAVLQKKVFIYIILVNRISIKTSEKY